MTTQPNADLVLRQIRAIRNWTNPKHAVLLPWPDVMLQMLWSQKPVHDDEFMDPTIPCIHDIHIGENERLGRWLHV